MSSRTRATAFFAGLLIASGPIPQAWAAPKPAASGAHPPRLVLRGSTAGAAVPSTAEYGGVTPGLPTMPRIALPRDAANHCYITWTGFQLLPNGSRVFLQLNRTPDKAVHTTAGEIRVELGTCRVHRWNNLLPLDLRFFDTPVSGARVKWTRRQGATLRVGLKRAASPRVEVVQLQGWTYLFLTFQHPRGRPAAVAPAAAASRRPPPPRRAPKGPSPP